MFSSPMKLLVISLACLAIIKSSLGAPPMKMAKRFGRIRDLQALDAQQLGQQMARTAAFGPRTRRGEGRPSPTNEALLASLMSLAEEHGGGGGDGLSNALDVYDHDYQEEIDPDSVVTAPVAFDEASPEWKLALIQYLLAAKAAGRQIVGVDSLGQVVSKKDGLEVGGDVVCKVSPYRVCYRMGGDGKLRPLGKAQPVNIMRVYRRKRTQRGQN